MIQRVVQLLFVLAVFGASAGAQGEPSPLVLGETFRLHSEVLGEERVINVYRPPGAEPGEALPVLYMPDGGVGEDFVHIAGLLQISAMNGTMRPFLLVGIENTERRRDLTGPTEVESDRNIAPRVGGSAAFRSFFRDELMPEIERRYATTGERAIVGESLAGLFVVETLLLEADLFDTYVAVDPSLWWNDEGLVAEASGLLRARQEDAEDDFHKTLFLANADDSGEIAEATGRLTRSLRGSAEDVPGLEWHHVEFLDETHRTIYHPAAMRGFRDVLAPGTVFLDGQRKTTLATVQLAEAGDRGCYLDLLDAEGEPFQELGTFEVCEQGGIHGKRVRLEYDTAQVPVPECGGDPECDRTTTVILVERVEVLRPWVPSHCHEGEAKVFSCGSTEQRVVSLCASGSLTADTGTLQFRWGPWGEAPSRVVPEPAAHPAEHFRSGMLTFSGGGGAYLAFQHEGARWVVFTGIGKGWQKEGLVVSRPGEDPVEYPCRSEWVSELGPGFFEQAGIPADGEGFEIP